MLKRKTKKRIVRGRKRKNGGAYAQLPAASLEAEVYKKYLTMENLEEDFKPGVTTQSNDLKPLIRHPSKIVELLLILAKKPIHKDPSRHHPPYSVEYATAVKHNRDYHSSMTFKELTEYLHTKLGLNPGKPDNLYYVTSNPILEFVQDEIETVDGVSQILSGISYEDMKQFETMLRTGLTFRLLCICRNSYPEYMFFIYEDILSGDNYRSRRRVFIRITNMETKQRLITACRSRFKKVKLTVDSRPTTMTKVKDMFTSFNTSMRSKHKPSREGGGMKKSRKYRR